MIRIVAPHRRPTLAVFAVIAASLAATGCRSADADGWHAAVRDFLGEDRVTRILSAESVAAWRVDGSFHGRSENPADVVQDARASASGFPIVREGPALTADQRARFTALVQDADSYLFDVEKGCIFAPGVAVRFDGPAGPLDVLLCFSCDEWAFALPSDASAYGDRVIEDFDPVRADLRALAREWFPDDPAFR